MSNLQGEMKIINVTIETKLMSDISILFLRAKELDDKITLIG